MAKLDVAQFIARSDNFAVLLHDPKSGTTAAIDAPDADPIIAALKERGWTLTPYLRHAQASRPHRRHPGAEGGLRLRGDRPGGERRRDRHVRPHRQGRRHLRLGGREVARHRDARATRSTTSPLHCRTRSSSSSATLIFSLGCGRVIEGDHAMMWDSIKRLRALPDDTQLYCGHEYTLANAKFAVTVDPDNAALKKRAGGGGEAARGRTSRRCRRRSARRRRRIRSCAPTIRR